MYVQRNKQRKRKAREKEDGNTIYVFLPVEVDRLIDRRQYRERALLFVDYVASLRRLGNSVTYD